MKPTSPVFNNKSEPDNTVGLPAYVQREFYDYLQCGILAHGFLRLGCDTCKHEMLLPFSCKRRGFCPSCAGRRMAQMAAHLVEQVIPWVPTRQWVVSVPVPLRYWMAASQDLTATVHTIIRTTIGQYDVHQAVQRGLSRQKVQPGSVTFIQRFGSAINPHLHFHVVFLEGGSLRIIAAITQDEVIRTILRHLKLAVDPPPIAPARVRQETFAWSSA